METKKKLQYIYILTLTLVIGTLIFFARYLFYSQFENLEYKKIGINNDLVRNEILKNLGEINFKNKEWSSRQTIYELMEKKDYRALEKNLNLSALRNLNIDLILYGDEREYINGYNLSYDHDFSSIGLQQVPTELIKKINYDEYLKKNEEILEIYDLKDFGVWLISEIPITKRYQVNSVGKLLMAKKIDASYFRRLSQNLAVKVYFKGVENEKADSTYQLDNFLVSDNSLELANNKFFVYSIFHTPEILIAGKRSFSLFLVTSSLMIIIILGLTYYVLNRSLFNPILNLQREVSKLDLDKLKEIKQLSHDKEISELTQTINSLIKRVKEDYELLVQKGKLESLGLMAGGIAHEINNPLTILKTNSAIMLRHLKESNDLANQNITTKVEKNLKTIDRIADIISGLQRISRHSSEDELITVEAKNIIRNIENLHTSIVEDRNIIVEYIISEHSLKFKGLEQQITQILINLIMNSTHAIKDMDERWIRVELLRRDHLVIYRVVDSGHGIDSEIKDKVMEPFFTTKEIGRGTGLGLSICKKIAHYHGGDLKCLEGEANTTFELSIPVLTESSTSAA